MQRPLKIVLADDHAMVREGVKLMLSIMDDITVTREASDAAETWAALRAERPDLLLLDLGMPGIAGVGFVGDLREAFADLRIVVLTANLEPRTVRAALDAGAHGYLTKHGDADELSTAIDAVRRGETYVSPAVRFALDGRAEAPAVEVLSPIPITRRERQMLALVAQGVSSREAAERLGVSLPTARKHRENLMRKLGLHSAAELAAYAVRLGLPTA